MSVSESFATFMREAPAHAQAWTDLAQSLSVATALDDKTAELAYLAVLAVTGNTSGIAFHTLAAKSHGATKQEVLSAVLVGLPAAGAVVIGALPAALEAYDRSSTEQGGNSDARAEEEPTHDDGQALRTQGR